MKVVILLLDSNLSTSVLATFQWAPVIFESVLRTRKFPATQRDKKKVAELPYGPYTVSSINVRPPPYSRGVRTE